MDFTEKNPIEDFKKNTKIFQEWIDRALPENYKDATPEDIGKLAQLMEAFAQEQFRALPV
jgi:hypothetical protein